MPILTITPNPAIDQTVELPQLRPGAVHVAQRVRSNAGGKGINVAACLADWGADVAAAGLLGADNGAVFEALFAQRGIADRCQRVPGATRTNIKLVAADTRETTDINLPAPPIPAAAWEALLADARRWATQPSPRVRWALGAGSLPADVRPSGYGPLLCALAGGGAGVRLALDTSGAALPQALAAVQAAGLRLDLMKPNVHELGELVGQDLKEIPDIVQAARLLHRQCVNTVVVSMGEKGAILSTLKNNSEDNQMDNPIDNPQTWFAAPLPVEIISTVGAGDAQVAGLLAACDEGKNWADALRYGVAFASAKLRQIGPYLPEKSVVQNLVEKVHIQRLN